jgi:hypothetical protein
MKWLTTILCLLAFQATAQNRLLEPSAGGDYSRPAETDESFEQRDYTIPTIPEAQDPEQRMVTLPAFIQCAPVAPDTMLEQGYNELGFLEGLGTMFISPSLQTVNGKFRMFVDPEDKSWTVMLEIGSELHCMVMSGEQLGPMVQGDEI